MAAFETSLTARRLRKGVTIVTAAPTTFSKDVICTKDGGGYSSNPTDSRGPFDNDVGYFSAAYRSWMHFDLEAAGALPGLAVVSSAILKMAAQVLIGTDGATACEAARLTEPDWVEDEACWQRKKDGVNWSSAGGTFDAGSAVPYTMTSSTGTDTQIVDVTTLGADAVVNRDGQLHILLKKATESGQSRISYKSLEGPFIYQAPHLALIYQLSGGPGMFYHWYLDGAYVGMTVADWKAFDIPDGTQARIRVLVTDDPNFDAITGKPEPFPARRSLWWVRSVASDLREYRVEQQINGGGYSAIARVPHDDTVWAYSFLTDPLEDLASHQWRVIPVDIAANDGTEMELDAELIVRNPDAPQFGLAFNSGTRRITINAS